MRCSRDAIKVNEGKWRYLPLDTLLQILYLPAFSNLWEVSITGPYSGITPNIDSSPRTKTTAMPISRTPHILYRRICSLEVGITMATAMVAIVPTCAAPGSIPSNLTIDYDWYYLPGEGSWRRDLIVEMRVIHRSEDLRDPIEDGVEVSDGMDIIDETTSIDEIWKFFYWWCYGSGQLCWESQAGHRYHGHNWTGKEYRRVQGPLSNITLSAGSVN